MLSRRCTFRLPGRGDFAIPSAASLNGTLMCLVGLLRLLQVRPVLILPSRETSHSHRRPSRARLASPYKQMAARNGVRRNTRPNAFVSIRVSSPDVRAGIEKIQQEMVGKDRRLQSAMVSLDKLHLTLMVLRLESKEEEERASKLLCEVTRLISTKYQFDKDPMRIVVRGIGSFGGRVVFAKVAGADRLSDIADMVRGEFERQGLPSTDSRGFNAHLTIAKTAKSPLGTIPQSSYAHLSDTHFGVDDITNLELLSMTRPADDQGYYHCFSQHPF